jgi:uncharacterized protein
MSMPARSRPEAEPAAPRRDPNLLQLRSDRRLGHEWDDWDGNPLPDDGEFRGSEGLFFLVAAVAAGVAALVAAGVLWLVAPRLGAVWPVLPGAIAAGLVLLTGLAVAWLAAVASVLRSRRNWLPERLAEGGLLPWLMLPLERLGVRVGLGRDRVGNALLRVYNGLAAARARPGIRPDDLLVLLPRCLGKEAMQAAMSVSARYGVPLFVASRGRYARQMIAMRRPRAVVAVACERDLVSGIHDVAGRLPVLGTTLALPDGPCKNTVFDPAGLDGQIRAFLGLGPQDAGPRA